MKILKKILVALAVIVGLLIPVLLLTWFLGPKAEFNNVNPTLSELKLELDELDSYLSEKEALVPNIKAENESRIIWADSIRQTEYALVYLHGFSAGPMEGAPLHQEVASRYGMNLYLPRLSKHGIQDDDIFLELTPDGLMESAKEALVIGKKLGKKVILMSCSTGGTLGIYLTANHPDIHGHLMYSPNIKIFDPTSEMLTGPWGLKIVKQVLGDYRIPTEDPEVPDSVQQKIDQYWSGKYRVEGIVALQSLLDQTMTDETFAKVNQPYFLGYYYKSDTAQDNTVSVEAMLDFDSKTKTPKDSKRAVAFPEAGSHVINSPLTSKQYERVREETYKYLEEVLNITPLNTGQ